MCFKCSGQLSVPASVPYKNADVLEVEEDHHGGSFFGLFDT